MKTVDALLETARENTGLIDFGDERFMEGLTRLVDSLRHEARLNAVGEHLLEQRLVMHLEQRLGVEEWYRQNPEIDAVQIIAPLIGISLPRTGSTALSHLLGHDPAARSLLANESAKPSQLNGAAAFGASDAAALRPPGARRFVPAGDNPPAECQELMALDFRSQLFLAFAQMPSYADWLLDADLSSTYAYERRVLKLLQWRQPQARWRLKAPSHLLYLRYLSAAFPDARFVMTHRDPAEVMVSVSALYTEYVSKLTDHVDPHYLGGLNTQQWVTGMQRTLAFRADGQEHRFYDIHFMDMREDPVAAVRGLYDWLDEPVSDEFERTMRQWWAASQAEREGTTYPDPTYFGLDLDAVRDQFSDYIRAAAGWTGRAL